MEEWPSQFYAGLLVPIKPKAVSMFKGCQQPAWGQTWSGSEGKLWREHKFCDQLCPAPWLVSHSLGGVPVSVLNFQCPQLPPEMPDRDQCNSRRYTCPLPFTLGAGLYGGADNGKPHESVNEWDKGPPIPSRQPGDPLRGPLPARPCSWGGFYSPGLRALEMPRVWLSGQKREVTEPAPGEPPIFERKRAGKRKKHGILVATPSSLVPVALIRHTSPKVLTLSWAVLVSSSYSEPQGAHSQCWQNAGLRPWLSKAPAWPLPLTSGNGLAKLPHTSRMPKTNRLWKCSESWRERKQEEWAFQILRPHKVQLHPRSSPQDRTVSQPGVPSQEKARPSSSLPRGGDRDKGLETRFHITAAKPHHVHCIPVTVGNGGARLRRRVLWCLGHHGNTGPVSAQEWRRCDRVSVGTSQRGSQERGAG